MAGFFSRMFGGGARELPPVQLDHPRDLRTGDIIKLGFLEQSELSGKTFEITHVNTYIYGNMCYPELILKDRTGTTIFLMVEEEDGEEYLAFSKKVARNDVRKVLSQDKLDAIIKARAGTTIHLRKKPAGMEEWLADNYTKTDDQVTGMFLAGDARSLSNEEMKRTEPFTSYTLVDSDDKYALEIEVYGSGELELSLTVYHDMEALEEMWPGKN